MAPNMSPPFHFRTKRFLFVPAGVKKAHSLAVKRAPYACFLPAAFFSILNFIARPGAAHLSSHNPIHNNRAVSACFFFNNFYRFEKYHEIFCDFSALFLFAPLLISCKLVFAGSKSLL